jgi:glycine cleavage system protein P-like pyridoxal-binding family
MNTLFLIEATMIAKVAKQGIKEAEEQITLCGMELNQPLSIDEASEIIADMMELNIHKAACEKALIVAKEFIKKNRFVLN